MIGITREIDYLLQEVCKGLGCIEDGGIMIEHDENHLNMR